MNSSVKVFLFFLVMSIPSGIFVYFTSSAMGYPRTAVGIVAGAVLVVGLTLLAVGQGTGAPPGATSEMASEVEPVKADAATIALKAKTGWAVLVGFLLLMGCAVAYFTLSEH